MVPILFALFAFVGLYINLRNMHRNEGWSLGLIGAVFLWFAVVGGAIWWIVAWDTLYQHHRNWLTIGVSALIVLPSFVWMAKACIRYGDEVKARTEAQWAKEAAESSEPSQLS